MHHTASRLDADKHTTRIRGYLQLNKNNNKHKVMQNKTMQYYFVGNFDLAPFVSMPAVLVEVLSCGKSLETG
jgi:hypothetical protein